MSGGAAVQEKMQAAATAQSPGQLLQAVFSVCAGEDVVALVMEAVAAVPGAEFIGQFGEYITAEKSPQFPEVMKTANGCVALIDCDRDPDESIETMERLQKTFIHGMRMVAIASEADPKFLVRAMRAGCDDILTRPIDKATLAEALQRFQNGPQSMALTGSGQGKILSFYGVKGGVGTTTMAVHLAVYLVQKHRKKVLLIDHKHELGHVALHLGLKQSRYHFDEMLRNADRLDAALLEGFVVRHPSGLEVIPSPDTCAPVQEGTADSISKVLKYLKTRYDYILIDSSLEYVHAFAPITVASDEIELVCTPDVASLRDLVRRVEHLSNGNGFADKLRLIVNRSTSDDAVSGEDIVKAARFPIAVSIPNNYAGLLRALNEGEPVPLQTRSPFVSAVAHWADRLALDGAATMLATTKTKRKFFLSW